jgi:hypothetical protein
LFENRCIEAAAVLEAAIDLSDSTDRRDARLRLEPISPAWRCAMRK